MGDGNTAEYEIHLNGINDMLKIRGGKQKLGMRVWLRIGWLFVMGPGAMVGNMIPLNEELRFLNHFLKYNCTRHAKTQEPKLDR